MTPVHASRLLPAKSSEALRAGSTGLFDPAGSSPFQVKAGRTLAKAEGREYLGMPSPTRPPQKRAASWIIHSPRRWYRRSVHRARTDEARAGRHDDSRVRLARAAGECGHSMCHFARPAAVRQLRPVEPVLVGVMSVIPSWTRLATILRSEATTRYPQHDCTLARGIIDRGQPAPTRPTRS
jgi:hypothetical protein